MGFLRVKIIFLSVYFCFACIPPTVEAAKAYIANGQGSIVVHDLDTKQTEYIYNVSWSYSSLAITPDGTKLYVVEPGSDTTVKIIDCSTLSVVKSIFTGLLSSDGAPPKPIISPDGTMLAFVSSADSSGFFNRIIVVDVASDVVTKTITTPFFVVDNLVFSPDSKNIILRNKDDGSEFARLSVLNGDVDVFNIGIDVDTLFPAEDGKSFYAVTRERNETSYVQTLCRIKYKDFSIERIAVLDFDANSCREVTRIVSNENSKNIFLMSGSFCPRFGQFDKLDGSGMVRMEPNYNYPRAAALTPDGSKLVVATGIGGAFVYTSGDVYSGDSYVVSTIFNSDVVIAAPFPPFSPEGTSVVPYLLLLD